LKLGQLKMFLIRADDQLKDVSYSELVVAGAGALWLVTVKAD